ncbi:MAG: type IV pilin protein [Pseudomonadota bacterium]
MIPPAHSAATAGHSAGFSLVELLAVLALLGILTATAYPAYTEQLRQSRRVEGMSALLELATRLEGYRADHGTYAGAALGAGALFPAASRNGHYRLAIEAASATGYRLSATPTRSHDQHRDRCGTLTLDSLGVRGTSNASGQTRCWR